MARRWGSVPGQGSGISWSYFLMLSGAAGVKADRMIRRFVAEALGRADETEVSMQEAIALVTATAERLGVSAATLDHQIWLYQRARGVAWATGTHVATGPGPDDLAADARTAGMTDPAVFLRTGGGLVPMRLARYDAEEVLQQVLRDYPTLIAGVATTGDSGRLLLVKREMPVRGPAGNSGLSLDHLFVDHTGVPVLIEVKQAHDTRSRREVVAQMLDYAANGSVEWTAEQLRTAAEQTARDGDKRQNEESADAASDLDPAELLSNTLGIEENPGDFWQGVESNLRRGRMRMIFLADQVWPELIRIIEFLNAQMPNLDVLAVELPQYVGEGGLTVYVPRVVGQTSAAIAAKASSSGRTKWTESTLLAQAEEQRSESEVALLQRLIAHVNDRGGHFYYGDGASPGMTGYYTIGGQDTPVWNLNLSGKGFFYWIFRDFSRKQEAAATERLGEEVAALPGMAAEVARVSRLNWRGWASMLLESAADHQEAVLSALSRIAAGSVNA